MLQEQNAAQTRDMEHLQSRNGDLTHRYTEADMRCGELAADLVTANTMIEQLRNETANLRAEKNIWEVSMMCCATCSVLSIRCRTLKRV